MRAIFVYGSDYQRAVELTSPLQIVSDYWFIPLWFLLTTTVLHIIRLNVGIKRKTITTTILHMIVIFFGGGTVRYRHRIEKAFIIIVIFGMFFLQSIWVSNFLSKMSALHVSNSVNTMSKVAKLKKPIYFADELGKEYGSVAKILR